MYDQAKFLSKSIEKCGSVSSENCQSVCDEAKTHKINLFHYIPDFFIKTLNFRLKLYLVFSHSMFYVAMNFCEKCGSSGEKCQDVLM